MNTVVIIFIVILVLVWLASRRTRRAPSRPVAERVSLAPTPTVTVSHSSGAPTEHQLPDCGSPQRTPDGCWILNPKSPFPLSIVGVDEATIQTLRSTLDRLCSNWDGALGNELTGIVARSNLRCKELDAYCSEYRPKFQAAVKRLQDKHPEWQAASELDRQDLMSQFEPEALASLDLLPCGSLERNQEIVLSLFCDEAENPTVDDALLDRYGFELASFYLRLAGDLTKVHNVPAESWQRKKFESLGEAHLARRGAEIPLEQLLTSLRLKDLNEFLSDPSAKRFTRKAAAIEYLVAQPNTRDQLSTRISFRELFQLLPLPEEFSGLDLAAVARHWRHSDAIAKTITATFRGGISALEEREMHRGLGSDVAGWEVDVDEDASPYCKRVAEKAAKSSRMPKLPAHVGCSCRAFPRFR